MTDDPTDIDDQPGIVDPPGAVTSEDPDPPDDSPDPAGTPSPERASARTVPAGAFVVAVMVAAALGILAVAVLAASGNGDDEGQQARLAAGRFAERFLTFEHDALDDWKADVLRLSTGGFAGEVEDVESGLRRLIADDRLDATTQVTEVFLGEADRGSVDVVVVYDRDLVGGDFTRSETDRYLQLSLVRIDGTWLVDDVIDIATAEALSAGG